MGRSTRGARRSRGVSGGEPDARSFVQVARQPSLGVEVATGRAWVGVDQQVGHGSADALFALTDEQYAAALIDPSAIGTFEMECWRGEHDDLLLHHPRTGPPTHPWTGLRSRMIPPRLAGEIWHHVDALGRPEGSARLAVSRALAAGTALVTTDADGVVGLTFRLVGDGAYPRPAALVAGLTAGVDRERARSVLGDPVEVSADGSVVHAVEADRVRLGFAGDGLVEISLERPPSEGLPEGGIRAFLEVLGEPDGGAACRAVAALAGGTARRWAVSSGFLRRLIAFDGGVELQVQDARVLSSRIRLVNEADGGVYRHAGDLLAGVPRSPSRDDVHRALGPPAATSGSVELHRRGGCDLVVEYGPGAAGGIAREMTAVPTGTSVSHGIHRWRSGEFALFLDVLGLEESHPLVGQVRNLAGVRLGVHGGVVAEVVIGDAGHRTERLAAFVDGMPGEPTRTDVPFGRPSYVGDRDDLRDFDQGWVHVHAADGTSISTITISREAPRALDAHRWTWHRDR